MQGLAAQGLCPQVAGKKVHWIVPTPAGGGFDIYSRLITPFYEKVLGGKIFIKYVPGAGTIIGSKRLKEAAPNGLTLGILNAPALLVALLTAKMEARLVPLTIVTPALGLIFFQLLLDLVPQLAQKYS